MSSVVGVGMFLQNHRGELKVQQEPLTQPAPSQSEWLVLYIPISPFILKMIFQLVIKRGLRVN